MQNPSWQTVLSALAGVLVLKVTLNVVVGYEDYFPPNFQSDFLLGRQSYFYGAYSCAFYAHIVAGPLALALGIVLISDEFRRRFIRLHRALGKLQVANILLVLTPSGLWMASYAATGAVAAVGFAVLSVATSACAAFGWRTAVKRQIAAHRRWMWRCFLLLCSAVVLRLIGGLAAVTDVGDQCSYPLAAWVSWLGPLAVFELGDRARRRSTKCAVASVDQSSSNSGQSPLNSASR